MSSLRPVSPASCICGRCGYSACICCRTELGVTTHEYAPFGIHAGDIPLHERKNGRLYGDSISYLRSEIDGLQAAVYYLDALEAPAEETPSNRIHHKSSNGRLLELEQARSDPPLRPRTTMDNNPQKLASDYDPTFPYSTPLTCTTDPLLHDSSTDQLFEDETQYDNENKEWRELSDFFPSHLLSATGPAQKQSSKLNCEPFSTRSQEEGDCMSQQATWNKEMPTVSAIPSEETTNVENDESSTSAKKCPRKSQWATLRELRRLFRIHYMKFLGLTAKHNSRGIKRLRQMYGSPKGMLDAGITTFRDVLEGQEPQSLKEIFAFTCLSFVMSKLLQDYGGIEGSLVPVDTDRWSLSIKKEKDRIVYDEAVRILWPDIGLSEEKNEINGKSIPIPTESPLGNVAPTLDFRASTGPFYVPSSMWASGITAYSDFDFLSTTRAIDCFKIGIDIQSTLQVPSSCSNQQNEPRYNGLFDHVMGLLQETSTHDDFMFADFLNFGDPRLDNNLEIAPENLPLAIAPMIHPPMMHPPIHQLQIFSPSEPAGTIDPKKIESSSDKSDQMTPSPPLLIDLVDTIMFQVAVAFMKFTTSLGTLLFRLSGCGITSRHKRHEIEGYVRPAPEFGEFVTSATKLVLEPIEEDLGGADESVRAVVNMANTFVRLGHLHTVREIEEYIITTARNVARNYESFVKIVSITLKQCLAASNRMTWDQIYPSYSADQEDYSTTYIKKIKATEIGWALQHIQKEDGDEKSVNFIATDVIQAAKSIIMQQESHLASKSDSSPSKKQKTSSTVSNATNDREFSTTPASSSGSESPFPSKAKCYDKNCGKIYTGNDARVNLRRHIRTVHERCKTTKCPICGLESPRRDNLRKHFFSMHKGEEMPAMLKCKTRGA